MGWRDWLGLGKKIEAGPPLLAAMFLAGISKTMQGFISVTERTGTTLTEEQWLALFQQLCLYQDAVWRQRLPQRIAQTGRVAPGNTPDYLERFRQASMQAISTAEFLPPPYRDWTANPPPKIDFALYNEESIPPEYEDDFRKVLGLTKLERTNLPARFYLRVCQIVGLFERRDVILHFAWWSCIGSYAPATAELIDQVVPLPE